MLWDSIKSDLFGAALIAAVLIALALMVKLLCSLYERARDKDARPAAGDMYAAESDTHAAEGTHYAQGRLKLIDVDEKTAALVMAIVSHESGMPLSELDFHSIRLIV